MTSSGERDVKVIETGDKMDAESCKCRGLLIAQTSILIILAVVSVGFIVSAYSNRSHNHHGWKTVSKFVESVCSQTPYPSRCASSMAFFTDYQAVTLNDLSKIALKESIERAQKALEFAVNLQNNTMNERERAVWQDCAKLFEDTVHHLDVCLRKGSIIKTATTWLSAALTNQDTCLNGFRDLNLTEISTMRALLSSRAVDLSELVSNSLSINKLSSLSSQSVKNRRLLSVKEKRNKHYSDYGRIDEEGFPEWVSGEDRRLLQLSSPARQADIIVAQDGSGDYRTIAEALATAPLQSSRRYVIYIKEGIYKENIDISVQMTNLMFIGDGMHRTVVSGSRNVQDGVTTFSSATFGVCGNGFIARDMMFENNAGPTKQQAVALRVGADQSVVYRCCIKGYQDTLYAYSLRQFYSHVDIYGTIDFIFGNAAVVIQNSNIYVRRPMTSQPNVITAQGRTDPNQNTGISIQNCRITAASDLQEVKTSIKTYLGRPWKEYSRTVIMQSTLDDLIDPAGWLQWNGGFALKTLYYGEYMNSGIGARTSGRVNWPGFHVITSASEASKFTVSNFISGNSWIPAAEVGITGRLELIVTISLFIGFM